MDETLWSFPHLYFIIHVLIILLFVGHLLNERKTPTSTLAWFLVVLIRPSIGLPLYIILGSRKIIRKKPKVDFHEIPETVLIHNPIQKVLISTGSPPPGHNSNITLLTNGTMAFNEVINLIGQAQKTIYLETFIFKDDFVGQLVLESLTKRAKEGLDVKVMLDSLGSHMPGHPSFKEFIKAGGKLSMFMPVIHRPFRGRANLRNHRKFITVDQRIAMVGGMNIAEEYMGPNSNPERWVDLAMTIEGPIVTQIDRVFLLDWSYVNKKLALKKLISPVTVDGDRHLAQLATGGPDNESDPIYEMLLTAIYGAQKQIWITTPYFVPDESLAKAIELAGKRGVEVRLAIPKKSNHFLADLGRITYLEQVHSAGVQIYQYPKMLHAKLILVDDTFGFLGSANMDSRSLLLNYELGICMYSPEDIQKLKLWCDSIFNECDLNYKKIGRIDSWVGGVARLFSPLI